jgi:hypothetical protein
MRLELGFRGRSRSDGGARISEGFPGAKKFLAKTDYTTREEYAKSPILRRRYTLRNDPSLYHPNYISPLQQTRVDYG